MTRPSIRTCAVLLAAIICLGTISVSAVPATVGAATDADEHAEPEGDAGDTRDNATEVSAGETVDGTFDGEEDSDTDWYALDVEAGDYIRLTHRGGADGPPIELYGPTGEKLAEDSMYVDALATGARALVDGTYYVKVPRVYPRMLYSITFDIASPDDFEPNDQLSEAAAIESGAELSAVVGEGDEDYWSIDVLQPGELSVDVDNERIIGAGVAVEVINPDGDVIARSETNCSPGRGPCDIPELTPTVDSSGEYYVRVSDAGVPGFNRYDLSLSVETLPPVVGDAVPTDPDGDGRYEDVNGNDRLDFGDVVALFANIRSDAVTDHADAYDFNGNGRIDFGDVVALFGEIVG